ncbi:MAG: hypothetical protein ACFN27_06095, partial [Prevotella sp.]
VLGKNRSSQLWETQFEAKITRPNIGRKSPQSHFPSENDAVRENMSTFAETFYLPKHFKG